MRILMRITIFIREWAYSGGGGGQRGELPPDFGEQLPPQKNTKKYIIGILQVVSDESDRYLL